MELSGWIGGEAGKMEFQLKLGQLFFLSFPPFSFLRRVSRDPTFLFWIKNLFFFCFCAGFLFFFLTFSNSFLEDFLEKKKKKEKRKKTVSWEETVKPARCVT